MFKHEEHHPDDEDSDIYDNETDEDVNLLRKNSNNLLCDECDFAAKNVNGLNMHIKAKHTKNSN